MARTKKRGLGRGLSSLIPEEIPQEGVAVVEVDTVEGDELMEIAQGPQTIPIDSVIPNPYQPRKVFNQEELEDLVSSIKIHGVIQPLTVSETNDGLYELIAGERRLQASKIAGLDEVPIIVREASNQEKLEVAIIENIQRHNLNPIEEARAYDQLIAEFELTQTEVATRLGKKRASVANTIRLLSLPDEIIDTISTGKLSEGHAKALMGVDDRDQQMKLLRKILDFNLTVRETEGNVKRIKIKKGSKSIKDPHIVMLEERLQEELGTKVKITKGKNGGEISISFFSEEDLQSLIDKITLDT